MFECVSQLFHIESGFCFLRLYIIFKDTASNIFKNRKEIFTIINRISLKRSLSVPLRPLQPGGIHSLGAARLHPMIAFSHQQAHN
jgi:hypothetical protein